MRHLAIVFNPSQSCELCFFETLVRVIRGHNTSSLLALANDVLYINN